MRISLLSLRAAAALLLVTISSTAFTQSRGVKTITAAELRYHLEFLGSPLFRGRETPSPELEIATLYITNWLKMAGVKPLLPDGSYCQRVPLTVTAVAPSATAITVTRGTAVTHYAFGEEFGGSFLSSGTYRGEAVFAGTGVSDPDNDRDDLRDLDLRGKVVIILDVRLPGETFPPGFTMTGRLNERIAGIRSRGAAAVLSVVSIEREIKKVAGIKIFDYIPTGRPGVLYDTQRTNFSTAQEAPASGAGRPPLPFERAEISHDLAAAIMGVTKEEIAEMFTMISEGKKLAAHTIPGVEIRLDTDVNRYKAFSDNILAVVEGSDPMLKDEYTVVCGHHDARGIDDGEIIAGADDNGTGTVALIEIAQALMTERPRRSVILAWFTGEEQSMNGSHYFVNNSPVPPEKISACLNIDMIGRNSPDSLFLVGSDMLSTELDGSINMMNKRQGVNFAFDYTYSNRTHPQRVYFRSDHYPFVRFGIPSVWFFCGFTRDYHTSGDVPEAISYDKFLKATRLVYLTAFDTGNRKEMLRLDVNPAVTTRGAHNMKEESLFRYAGE